MILGIGNDTVDIRRIERTLERHGERFQEGLLVERLAPTGPDAHVLEVVVP